MKKYGTFSMKQRFLKSKLITNVGCRIELSGMGNYPEAIALGGNCPGIVVLRDNYSRRALWSRQLCRAYLSGDYCLVAISFPSYTFK